MKKLMNKPEGFVGDSLKGMQAAHGNLISVNFDPCFVVRKNVKKGKVALVSGGGSGHEPTHTGFVGHGMLDAACPGEVFTSPTPDQMEAAAKATNSGEGVIFFVKNYTGDVLNFQMAAELCSAQGMNVSTVIIKDDVALEDSPLTAGRRGAGSIIFAEKICGASAERGDSMEKVLEYAEYCVNNGRSMGMALTPCTVPAVGKPTFTLGNDEIEMGIGIHGEYGCERMPLRTADEIVNYMTERIIGDLPFKAGDTALVMLNGTGGTPLAELYILYASLAERLKKECIYIAGSLVGNYITSLDMQGFSITMMKADGKIISLWDAPVCTPALRWRM